MKDVILASTSPRRLELLRATGLKFTAVTPNYEEDNTLDLPPHELVETLAVGKAQEVAARYPDHIVIAADTLVEIDGVILPKPKDAGDVRAMINRLSGRWHTAITGLAIIGPGHRTLDHVQNRVHFATLTPEQIDHYATLTEPLDKAGAYGIQAGSAGSLFIDQVDGDYQASLGLPIFTLNRRLAEFGIDLIDYIH